jgi:hypothetical protein
MGSSKEKSSGTTVVNQTTTPTPTAEETALNQRNLRIALGTESGELSAQQAGLNLVNQLLTGGTQLPGYFGQIAGGIGPQGQLQAGQVGGFSPMTEGQIDPNAVSAQAGTLMRQYLPGYQQGGLMDSGIMQADIQKRLTNDLLLPVTQQNIANRQAAQQFNIGTELDRQLANIGNQMTAQQYNLGQEYSRQGFNQGNLLNLLNLALSGQAQVQQPVQANVSQLGSQLAGLRSTNTQGTNSFNSIKSNPFLTGSDIFGGIGTGIGTYAALCWVAKEIFGSWEHPKTIAARYYIQNYSPIWFRNFYLKYGERIANFIHNKPLFKLALRPLFEIFAMLGEQGEFYANRNF